MCTLCVSSYGALCWLGMYVDCYLVLWLEGRSVFVDISYGFEIGGRGSYRKSREMWGCHMGCWISRYDE